MAEKRYYLEKSDDAGSTYHIIAQSNDLEELKERGDYLDLSPTRWVIKDRWTNSLVDVSSVHLSMLSALSGEDQDRDSFEPFVIDADQIDTDEHRKQEQRYKRWEAGKLRRSKLRDISKELDL